MANEVRIDVTSRDKSGAGFDAAERRAKGFSGVMGRVGEVAGGMLTANFAMRAGQGVVNFLGGMASEAREAEKVTASTAQGIKTMGAASWTSAAAVEALAEATSNKIGVDDELIQQSANLLLTFGQVKNAGEGVNAIFDRSVVLSQDLAAKGFGSADSSAKMLGKALNDPIKGMSALGKAGVTFSAEQKKAIEKMVESGDVLGAQKIILAEVERQVGGTAEATATSSEKMSTSWANFQEMLGERVMPIVDRVLDKLTGMTQWATEHQGAVAAMAAVIGGVLVAAFTAWAVSAAMAAAATIAATWPVLAIGAAVVALAVLVTKNFDTIKGAIAAAFNWVSGHWPLLLAILTGPFGLAVKFIIDHRDQIVRAVKSIPTRIGNIGSKIWGSITSGAQHAVNAVVGFINGIIDKINGLINAINRIPGVPDIPNVPHLGFIGDRSQPYRVTHLQHGGIFGGLAVVGEHGRELIRAPQGSTAIPHGTTEEMLARGGGGRQVVELRSDGSAFADFIIETLRRTIRGQGGDVQFVLGS